MKIVNITENGQEAKYIPQSASIAVCPENGSDMPAVLRPASAVGVSISQVEDSAKERERKGAIFALFGKKMPIRVMRQSAGRKWAHSLVEMVELGGKVNPEELTQFNGELSDEIWVRTLQCWLVRRPVDTVRETEMPEANTTVWSWVSRRLDTQRSVEINDSDETRYSMVHSMLKEAMGLHGAEYGIFTTPDGKAWLVVIKGRSTSISAVAELA